MNRLGLRVLDMLGTKLAIPLDYAEHDSLVSAALRTWYALVRMFVLFFAADESGIGFSCSLPPTKVALASVVPLSGALNEFVRAA